jgi:hypothetical protein
MSRLLYDKRIILARLRQRIRFGLRWRWRAYVLCRTTRFDEVPERDDLLLMVFCDRFRGHSGEHRDR